MQQLCILALLVSATLGTSPPLDEVSTIVTGLNTPLSVGVLTSGELIIGDYLNRCVKKRKLDGTVETLSGACGAASAYQTSPFGSSVRYGQLRDLTVDKRDNIYVVDRDNHCIRKVDAKFGGSVTVGGTCGSSGYTNGDSSGSYFANPVAATTDSNGNVYVWDRDNRRLRLINAAGTRVYTVAGDGSSGYRNGANSQAQFGQCNGLAIGTQSDAIYCMDTNNNVVRRIDQTTDTTTTYCGVGGSSANVDGSCTGPARFISPAVGDIAANGDLYFADFGSHTIRKVSASRDASTIAGVAGSAGSLDGSRAEAKFNGVIGIAMGVGLQTDHMYVADQNNDAIRKVQLASTVPLVAPESDRTVVTIFGDGVDALRQDASSLMRLSEPLAVQVLSDGTIVVGDYGSHCVKQLEADGSFKRVLSGLCSSTPGNNDAALGFNVRYGQLRDMHVDKFDNIYVVDRDNHCVRKVDKVTGSSTTFIGRCGTSGTAIGTGSDVRMNDPVHATSDSAGNLYVWDRDNRRLLKVTQAGVATHMAGNGQSGFVNGPKAVATFLQCNGLLADGPSDPVLCGDSNNRAIRSIEQDGTTSTYCYTGSGGLANGACGAATTGYIGVMVRDQSGNIYHTDFEYHAIRKITPGKVVSVLLGGTAGYRSGKLADARIDYSLGIAMRANGNLLIADRDNEAVVEVGLVVEPPQKPQAPTFVGSVSTIAGTGVLGHSVGPALSSQLNEPLSVQRLSNGDILIGDYKNYCVKKLSGGDISAFSGKCGTTRGDSNGATGADVRYGDLRDMHVDKFDNIYVVDRDNHCVRKVDKVTGGATTFIGKCGTPGNSNGQGEQVRLNNPVHATSDSAGNLYTWDRDNRVLRISTPIGVTTSLSFASGFVDGSSSVAAMLQCNGLAVQHPDSPILCMDSNNGAIRQVYRDGSVSTLCGLAQSVQGSFASTDCASVELESPGVGFFDDVGNLYFTDFGVSTGHIRMMTPQGKVFIIAGYTPGYHDGPLDEALFREAVGITRDGNSILVADRSHVIRRVEFGGFPTSSAQPPTPNPATCHGACVFQACTAPDQLITLNVVGTTEGQVWGSDPFTDDSHVGAAAVHAGKIAPGETKSLTIRCTGSQVSFGSAANHDVTTMAYSAWPRSFSFDLEGTTPQPQSPAPQVCSVEPCALNKCTAQGSSFNIVVTGAASASVWGTDTYSDDSHVGTAAVHRGLLQIGTSGAVEVVCTGAQSSYTGSTRNSVTTHNFGYWQYSYQLKAGPDTPPPSSATTCGGACLTGKCVSGASHRVRVTGTTYGYGWGSAAFTDDTTLAMAAVHAGLVSAGVTGEILVTCGGDQGSYTGTASNGVTTQSYSSWPSSFTIAPAPPVVFATCTGLCLHNICRIQGEVIPITVTGKTVGKIWGTSIYSDDSDPGVAAVHSGLLTPGQTANLLATCAGSQTSFESSLSGSVLSLPYGDWPYSFTLSI